MTVSMTRALPHEGSRTFLTDGGLETWLIFHRGIKLRAFAAFELIGNPQGRATLAQYFVPYLATAARLKTGFILDTPTWRASPDWGQDLGYSDAALTMINRNAVEFMADLRAGAPNAQDVLVNAVIGPRGDGYEAGGAMSAAEAQDYHSLQVDVFARSETDLISAITMTNVPEVVGIARAAKAADKPSVVSFTVETDGSLPSGQTLGDAITEVDAQTGNAPAYYMINCAHPDHFVGTLTPDAPWLARIRGVRANASRLSHAELDAAEHLDEGNPTELGQLYIQLASRIPDLTVVGGCCGTDHRHIHEICEALNMAA